MAGTLLHDFGQPRVSDRVKWNGVVLAASRGREVRSVYHGRVIFADWLAGLGLLVIVDHGESYMTLYGYNETILKNAGDWVPRAMLLRPLVTVVAKISRACISSCGAGPNR